MQNTESEKIPEPQWKQKSQYDIAKELIKTARQNYIESYWKYENELKKAKKNAPNIKPENDSELRKLNDQKFEALFTLAQARKQLIFDSKKSEAITDTVYDKHKAAMLEEAGLDKRNKVLGTVAEIGFGLIGLKVSADKYFNNKVKDFDAKMQAEKFKDNALTDPVTQKMIKFFHEQGLTSMKAVPGKNGELPTLKFSGKDPKRDISITFDEKGNPKGIACKDKTSANVDLFTKSLNALNKAEAEQAVKDKKPIPVYKVNMDEKMKEKLDKMADSQHDKYNNKSMVDQYKKLKKEFEQPTTKPPEPKPPSPQQSESSTLSTPRPK